MKTIILVFAAFIFILNACTTSKIAGTSVDDDVYFSPNDQQAENKTATSEIKKEIVINEQNYNDNNQNQNWNRDTRTQ